MKNYVDAKTVAEHLGKSRKIVHDWARRGWIPSYRIGKKAVLFVLEEVEASLKARDGVARYDSYAPIQIETLPPAS